MNHPLKIALGAVLALSAGACGKGGDAADGGADASVTTSAAARPKLVVAIVLDQFRADYLDRFEPLFGETGFKRLARHGASWKGHYGHYVTYTGPGHALILSGSYPYVNGITANKFYNRETHRSEAMVFDAESQILNLKKQDPDMDVSPRNFIGSTLGDELSLATAQQSRTIALATKGRGAILLGGRLGKSYYINDENGEMTTSTYYASVLPTWVTGWNAKKLADASFGKSWDKLLPEAAYAQSGVDDAKGEGDSYGLGKVFPHKVNGKLSAPGPHYYEAFVQTPFANEWELDFAKAAIENEQLGARGVTDLLAISISAIDLAGHNYGPSSHEVQDIVVRLDQQLGAFLDWVYGRLGEQNVVVLVTADHGATPIPEQMAALGFDAGRIKKKTISDTIEAALVARFGAPGAAEPAKPGAAGKPAPKDAKADPKAEAKPHGDKWVVALEDPHIFLNREAIDAKKLDPEEVERVAGQAAASLKGFGGFFTRAQLLRGAIPHTPMALSILRSYYAPRGGDVVMWTLPYYFWGKYGEKELGSTHGTFYRYDSEVPVLLSGPGVRPGKYGTREQVDIAATLAALLHITSPAGCEGEPVPALVDGPGGRALSVGADFIGWRGCPLQDDLEPEGFLGKLKLRGYRQIIEERVPEEDRAAASVVVQVTGRGERRLNHAGILAELGDFERGIPDCASCPLAKEGAPVSCYRYVTYPVDAASEEVIFDYFAGKVAEPDSVPNQIWRDITRNVDEESAWYQARGEGGSLAERAEPLQHGFTWEGEPHEIDSAQVLASLFIDLDRPALVVAYALLFKEILEAWRERIGLREDGSLEIRVDGEGADEAELQRRAHAALEEAQVLAGARTLGEIEDLSPMLLQTALHAVEDGWTVVVDG